MKTYSLTGCLLLVFLVLSAAVVHADIIILKNGQVIRDVTIKDEGDTLYCESADQSFYISKNSVDNIIRTGPQTLSEKTKDFVISLPQKLRLFVKDYFAFAATVFFILTVLLALIVFKFLWVNLSPIFTSGVRRRDVSKAVRQLDTDEQSVLREFYIQQASALEMPVEDRVVSGLIKKGILETTRDKGQYSAGGLLLPMIISPTAKKRIKPRTIGMPKNINDPGVREELAKSRPQYMYEMAEFYRSLEKKGAEKW